VELCIACQEDIRSEDIRKTRREEHWDYADRTQSDRNCCLVGIRLRIKTVVGFCHQRTAEKTISE